VGNCLEGFWGIRVVKDLPLCLLPVSVVSVLELCNVSVLCLLPLCDSESCYFLFDCPQVLDVAFPRRLCCGGCSCWSGFCWLSAYRVGRVLGGGGACGGGGWGVGGYWW
jgi:hypothetical protein